MRALTILLTLEGYGQQSKTTLPPGVTMLDEATMRFECPQPVNGVKQSDCSGIVVILEGKSLQSPIDVPAGIRYPAPSAIQMGAAAGKWFSLLAAGEEGAMEKVAEKVMICGPGLCSKETTRLEEGFAEASKLVFVIPGSPVHHAEGKGLRTASDRELLWKSLRKQFSGRTLRIRQPAPDELIYFWAMIPFDIDGVVLVAEGDGRVLFAFFAFDKKKQKTHLMWIDEVVPLDRFPVHSARDPNNALGSLLQQELDNRSPPASAPSRPASTEPPR